ncbi:hypothetical protein [Paenibacillus sanguinis]|uniref:hypothetical protein n=1 Tax=Paenibacillus sanguinis TaxID=225906 RepID=UPI00037B0064|nr:hypothetical protein [Paenibacillus sanguinis]
MNFKKKAIIFSAIAVLATTFASYSFASNDHKPSSEVKPLILDEKATVHDHKSFVEVTKPEVLNFLNESWNKGREKLIEIKGENIKNWKLINAGDVDIEFVRNLAKEEANSFNKAFFSEERKNSLQIGDRFPALLLSDSLDDAILFWERENGNIVYIEMSKTVNAKGITKNNIWSNGPAVDIK